MSKRVFDPVRGRAAFFANSFEDSTTTNTLPAARFARMDYRSSGDCHVIGTFVAESLRAAARMDRIRRRAGFRQLES
jgi:hypothetical protein